MVADFTVEFGHAGLALGNDSRGVVELAHTLLLSVVVVCVFIAFRRSLDYRVANLLALFGDFVRLDICKDEGHQTG